MRRKPKKETQPSPLLPALKAESSSLADQIAPLMARKLKIDTLIADLEGKTLNTARSQRVIRAHRPMPPDNPFFGLVLPEAATKQLSFATSPQSSHEIWDQLKEAGYPTKGKQPAHLVHCALQRREKSAKDVILAAGKWHMTAWYSADELAKIKAERGVKPGVNTAAHSAKTKAVVADLRARGIRWGAPAKTTPEVIAKVRNALAAGKSVKEACELAGISASLFYTKRAIFEAAPDPTEAMN